MYDQLPVESNVRVSLLDLRGNLLDKRESHNVLTNNGAAWLAQLVSSASYATDPPTPNTAARVKYIGLGCGGILQTGAGFFASQSALVTVVGLEDPVAYTGVGAGATFLKTADAQAQNPIYFPTSRRVRFIVDVLETEMSYVGNKAYKSQVGVETVVPISEAGLYLSSANTTGQDPTLENALVAYDVFSPMPVTPNNRIRVEWELRFR